MNLSDRQNLVIMAYFSLNLGKLITEKSIDFFPILNWFPKWNCRVFYFFLSGGAPMGFQHFAFSSPSFDIFICIAEGYKIIIVPKNAKGTSE